MRLSEEELQKILQQDGYAVFGEVPPKDNSTIKNIAPVSESLEKQPSSLERRFMLKWGLVNGNPDFVRNYRFDLPHSRMELDFAWPSLRIAIEINGGQALGNRSGHGNWNGLERDAVKQNRCIYLGWTLFLITTSMITDEHLQPIADYIDRQYKGDNPHAHAEPIE